MLLKYKLYFVQFKGEGLYLYQKISAVIVRVTKRRMIAFVKAMEYQSLLILRVSSLRSFQPGFMNISASNVWYVQRTLELSEVTVMPSAGADPGFFLGRGALVSCSTSIPINHIVFFFFAEYQLY